MSSQLPQITKELEQLSLYEDYLEYLTDDQDEEELQTMCSLRGVFACGYNSTKQTGTKESAGIHLDTFTHVVKDGRWLMDVVQVTCGEYFSTFLTRDNLVYSCGQNHHGQCGVGHSETVSTPTLVQELSDCKVVNVTCGYYHTIYQLDNGDVWTVGCANDGRLGLGPAYRSDILTPLMIDPKTFQYEAIVKVSCGGTYSLFLTDQNKVFCCGWNSYGQLGLSSNQSSVYTVQQIRSPQELLDQRIKEIVCGACHTIFLTENYEAWAVGWNTHGQLGVGSLKNKYQATRPFVVIIKHITSRRLARGAVGVIKVEYCAGRMILEQKEKIKKTPRYINTHKYFDHLSIVDVRVGDYHALFLTSDGQVWVCGENTKGQLGLPNKEIVFPPYPLPSTHYLTKGMGAMDRVAFSVGRNHSMVYYAKKEKNEMNLMRMKHLMLMATNKNHVNSRFVDCVIFAQQQSAVL
ncbi:hypothetical protein AKO1_015356 [Acrasis kona]|uniref:Uncharacterized protein n=1 Tax=Acrasis kona TaxID=1008807 RepID=A0AAW2ZEM4_9EUKA